MIYTTGTRFSTQQGRQAPPYHLGQLALTADRATLHQRTDTRIDYQVAHGLIEETRDLHARGYAWTLPSMSGLGYRQMAYYLRGEMTLEAAVQRLSTIPTVIRHQSTWFRRDPRWHWVDTNAGIPWDVLIRDVQGWLGGETSAFGS